MKYNDKNTRGILIYNNMSNNTFYSNVSTFRINMIIDRFFMAFYCTFCTIDEFHLRRLFYHGCIFIFCLEFLNTEGTVKNNTKP